MSNDIDRCCYKVCKEQAAIIYFGKSLCNKHWDKLSKETPEELKKLLNIKVNIK